MASSQIAELVQQYLPRIEVENVDYVPWNDATHDCAYLLLIVPKTFLQEYLTITKETTKIPGGMPDGEKLWKETALREKLSSKIPLREHEPLADILEFLGGKVQVDYQDCGESVRISIYEYPRELDVE